MDKVQCSQCQKPESHANAWCGTHKRYECYLCHSKCRQKSLDGLVLMIVREDSKAIVGKGKAMKEN